MILYFIYTEEQTKQVKIMLLLALVLLLQNMVFSGKHKIKHGMLKISFAIFLWLLYSSFHV